MNFLSSEDLSAGQMKRIFDIADKYKDRKRKPLEKEGPILALLFEKASTRTRLSFEAAMMQLGGHSIYIDAMASQLSRGESIADTAKVLGNYIDIIAARMYRHADLQELAKHSRVPVINALTDLEHPCQALSDAYTIIETFGTIKWLRIAFVGDIAANTANSLMVTCAKLGADISLIGPRGCKPNMEYVKAAGRHATIEMSDDLMNGLHGCDVIYTDTFVSMGQEKEAAKRRKMFAKYQVNNRVVKYANIGVKVMHCLPAHRGEEITSEVLDGRSSIVWQQAKNKLAVEKAILLYLLGAKK